LITWSGPPLMPRHGPDRIRFHVAPTHGTTRAVAIAHLLALGAHLSPGHHTSHHASHHAAGHEVLTDPDANEFHLLP
ncbi:MAG TPA: VOC family protein, partial [Ilumatobacteraceae bacterium]|nr:VOC family protein [Ilumatobacteraceae bacterium]